MQNKDISKSSSNEQHDYLTAFKNLENKVENMFQRLWQNPFHQESIPDIFPYGSLTTMPKIDVLA